MGDGGFVVKFDGKEACRCYKIALDHDEWKYAINNQEAKELPQGVKAITVESE